VLPNGDIVYSDSSINAIKRISPDGDITILSSSVNSPNGMTIGPNGHLYIAGTTSRAIYEVDPETGTTIEIALLPDFLCGITFSNDYKKLFVDGMFTSTIYELPFLENGALGKSSAFVNIEGTPNGMTVDECGNIYTALENGPLTRIGVDGTVETACDYGGQLGFTQNVDFGSGKHGWEKDKLYVVMAGSLSCMVFEIDPGVGAKHGSR